MPPSSQFDYIITGAGCAGLSLLMHMMQHEALKRKRILLIDHKEKKHNDRTWCFWETKEGLFQPIVYKEWKQLWLYANGIAKPLNIEPYAYKLIRGIDFYRYCFQRLAGWSNVVFQQAAVSNIASTDKQTYAVIEGEKVSAEYIFNSILFGKPVLSEKQYWLLQHFKGWIVETDKASFDPSAATLMDFRVDQSRGVTFFYVLPFSERKAMVEYTLFSPELLQDEEYNYALKQYIQHQLHIQEYQILEEEKGVIPMTNFSFAVQSNNIINIGTAGGQTKASSGYTFQFIQKQSEAIVQALLKQLHPAAYTSTARRFSFYDSVLLHILHHKKMEGSAIFTRLFDKNKPSLVLKFLDNETSLQEEMKILASLPVGPFLKAAIRQVTG